jgi:hypothetical protein
VISNRAQLLEARRKLDRAFTRSRLSLDVAQRLAYPATAAKLLSDIRRFDDVVSGRVECFAINGVEDIGRALVEARIARGWTQSRLASRAQPPR